MILFRSVSLIVCFDILLCSIGLLLNVLIINELFYYFSFLGYFPAFFPTFEVRFEGVLRFFEKNIPWWAFSGLSKSSTVLTVKYLIWNLFSIHTFLLVTPISPICRQSSPIHRQFIEPPLNIDLLFIGKSLLMTSMKDEIYDLV